MVRIVLVAGVLSFGASAGAFPYIVKKGDSLAPIAERIYGRIDLERVLVAANVLDDVRASTVVAGMRLEIPALGHHRVGKGDSWSSIAAELLGGAERGDALAHINGANPWAPPAIGREVIIPYNLRYVASQGDTTESVAYRFLGTRDLAWLVAGYNGKTRPELAQGQLLLVPLSDLPLTRAGQAAARAADRLLKSEAAGDARQAQDQAELQCATLEKRVRHGMFIEAIVLGAMLVNKGQLTVPQQVRIYASLTEAYVAVGARGLATDACRQWRTLAPELALDPMQHSPKILAACAETGAEQP